MYPRYMLNAFQTSTASAYIFMLFVLYRRALAGFSMAIAVEILREFRENQKSKKAKIVDEDSSKLSRDSACDFMFVQFRGGRQLEQLEKINWEESVREFLSCHYQHFFI